MPIVLVLQNKMCPRKEQSRAVNALIGCCCAEPCPRGSYCPPGSFVPTFCSNATFSVVTHAATVDACGPCPMVTVCYLSKLFRLFLFVGLFACYDRGITVSQVTQLRSHAPPATIVKHKLLKSHAQVHALCMVWLCCSMAGLLPACCLGIA